MSARGPLINNVLTFLSNNSVVVVTEGDNAHVIDLFHCGRKQVGITCSTTTTARVVLKFLDNVIEFDATLIQIDEADHFFNPSTIGILNGKPTNILFFRNCTAASSAANDMAKFINSREAQTFMHKNVAAIKFPYTKYPPLKSCSLAPHKQKSVSSAKVTQSQKEAAVKIRDYCANKTVSSVDFDKFSKTLDQMYGDNYAFDIIVRRNNKEPEQAQLNGEINSSITTYALPTNLTKDELANPMGKKPRARKHSFELKGKKKRARTHVEE